MLGLGLGINKNRFKGNQGPPPILYGPELITNGTFDTDISSWGAGYLGGQSVWNTGTMQIEPLERGTKEMLNQTAELVSGKTYRMRILLGVTGLPNTTTKINIQISKDRFAEIQFNKDYTSALGQLNNYYVDETFLCNYTGNGIWYNIKIFGGTICIDNVSIKEVL